VNAIDPDGQLAWFLPVIAVLGEGAAGHIAGSAIFAGALAWMINDSIDGASPAIPHPGNSPLSRNYENYLLDTYKAPGWPEPPDDWCPKLKKVIDEIASQIDWRKLDIKYWDQEIGKTANRVRRESHNVRIKRLNKKLNKLEKKYNDFCKPNC
jgi:hypothetical protein